MSASPQNFEQPVGRAAPRKSILKRYAAYLHERFPLLSNALLIVSFFSSNQFLAQSLDRSKHPVRYDMWSGLGALTICCFFLHVRIFDDHKDYRHDCEFYPNRVLQRGIVTLTDLKWLLAIVLLIECIITFGCGMATWFAWSAALLFSLLMLREFFLGSWLRDRFLLYASLHMLLIPALTAVIWSFATRRYFWHAPAWYWLYSLVSYLLAFNWEVSRKIRVPQDERDGVDSYSARFGTYGAAWGSQMFRVVSTILVMLLAYHMDLSLRFYGILLLLLALCSIGFVQHLLAASSQTAKRLEIYAGIYILAFDALLSIELASRYGIRIDAPGSLVR
ncbi:MAG: hypothetical protein KDB23_09235 [Planctomycetales bacterium]|nr:hypothetical protein [Planctomycetales bacterium]